MVSFFATGRPHGRIRAAIIGTGGGARAGRGLADTTFHPRLGGDSRSMRSIPGVSGARRCPEAMAGFRAGRDGMADNQSLLEGFNAA
ncbi:hypothetical protein EDC29_11516 [Marichromatium gracile]|uniref:Uncharacterized protein n=1 Tax=Marichromatium gracile TaxID=1048 RepID=A0A4R4A5S8_MARGR|nr:hypothetical protein EDC29_11516 [Marichromatium gracile]